MSKSTPGPWVWTIEAEDSEYPGAYTSLTAGEVKVLSATQDYDMFCWIEVSKSDANIIAAAPELLKACELLLDGLSEQGCDLEAVDFARKAIAKAKGEPCE